MLFTDLVGSTSFGERNDPEQTRTVMARYHALLQEVVDSHDGTVAKFMGDGMMATFGVPEVAEDDASRAVRAGIDIQRRFVEFASDVAAQHGEALALRVGVNTGEVVTADGDADLVGDALQRGGSPGICLSAGPGAGGGGDVATHTVGVRARSLGQGDSRRPRRRGRGI